MLNKDPKSCCETQKRLNLKSINLINKNIQAGPEILSDTHDELIELEAEGGEYEEKVERLRKRLDAVRVDMASRKERVDNYLEWSNRNKTLKSLKLKQFYIVGSFNYFHI